MDAESPRRHWHSQWHTVQIPKLFLSHSLETRTSFPRSVWERESTITRNAMQPKRRRRPSPLSAPTPRAARRGVVLVVVLIVVAVLALAAYTFTDIMYSHNESSLVSSHQTQAHSLVYSGVEYTRSFLMRPYSGSMPMRISTATGKPPISSESQDWTQT